VDPDAVGDGEWGRLGMDVLDGGCDCHRGRGSFGGEFGVSHCNQWGLCDVAFPKLLWAGLVVVVVVVVLLLLLLLFLFLLLLLLLL